MRNQKYKNTSYSESLSIVWHGILENVQQKIDFWIGQQDGRFQSIRQSVLSTQYFFNYKNDYVSILQIYNLQAKVIQTISGYQSLKITGQLIGRLFQVIVRDQ